MSVVGILFDLETPLPVLPVQAVIDGYKEIIDEASSFVYKFVDSAMPYQENYPAPVLEFNGKRYDEDLSLCCSARIWHRYQRSNSKVCFLASLLPRQICRLVQPFYYTLLGMGDTQNFIHDILS